MQANIYNKKLRIKKRKGENGKQNAQSVCSVFESDLIVPTIWNAILRDKAVIRYDRAGPGRAKGFSSQCTGQAATPHRH
jgi:hypothetical protein